MANTDYFLERWNLHCFLQCKNEPASSQLVYTFHVLNCLQ
jgi:hypothetical protein